MTSIGQTYLVTNSAAAYPPPLEPKPNHLPQQASLSEITLPPERSSPVPAATTAAPSPETVQGSAIADAPSSPPVVPNLGLRTIQRHDSALVSSRKAAQLGLTAEPMDSVQRFAVNCEDENILGKCCGTCVVRPTWALFRMTTHLCGAALSCLTGSACGCASLACRTVHVCTDRCEYDQPKKHAETTGTFAKSNFYLCLAGIDSIRLRTWNGADVLWQTLGDAVCREPCVECCAQNCEQSPCCTSANECINAFRNCSIKVAQCQEQCLPHPADQTSPTAAAWMKSECMNGIKWLVGSDNYFQFIHFAAARKKIQVPQRIPDAPAPARAGTLVPQLKQMQRG